MSTKSFDVVIPCFNPRDGWAEYLSNSLLKLSEFLPNHRIDKVFVVNDGSENDIKNDLSSLPKGSVDFQLVEHKSNRGKGAAIKTGLKHCESPLILFTDVDIPYQLQDMAMMLEVVESDEIDLALSIRGDTYHESLSDFRRLVSKGLISLNKKLFRLSIGDTQGGLKVMNRKGAEAFLETKIDRYLFDLEAMKIASGKGLKIKGVEVRLRDRIELPSLGFKVLLQEFGNLLKLLFRS